MPIDREATLRNAEKFLRVGRLDAAIAEYARVLEEQPRDWTTANTLGDLYLRAGQSEKAVTLYQRIAAHLLKEGFYPKAGALLKKILKITPDDEAALINLGEISAHQGLLAEAKGYFAAVASRRRGRGDATGADDMVLRLGALDPSDLDARLTAARILEARGDAAGAAAQFREIYDELVARGRAEDATAALLDYVRCTNGAVDSALLGPLIAEDLRAGNEDSARGRLRQLLDQGNGAREAAAALAWTFVATSPASTAICIDAVVDDAIAAGEYSAAVTFLQEFAARCPGDVHPLLRLIEVSIDGGLDDTMYDAQARLADAYIASGRANEARVIAEDLVSRDVSNTSHVDRLRRALTLLGIDDVETVIAERLNAGTDHAAHGVEAAESTEALTTGVPAVPTIVDEAPSEIRPALSDHSGELTPERVEVDLTSVLSELRSAVSLPDLGSPAQDLDEAFETLRAEAKHEADEDAGDYLGLARTYEEMGLQDEAMGALSMAARSPRHRFAAASELARLLRDRGDLPAAIEWYERAAEAPAPNPDDARAVLYDLGDILETLGETSRALAIFMELSAESSDYRDVGERVARLTAGEAGG